MSFPIDKLKFSLSMIIFGTIGIFVKIIGMPSAVICMCRGFAGALLLFGVMFVLGKKPNYSSIKNNFFWLFISGALLGFNWILLFESYKYTSIATATLCYYMAPVIIVIISPFVFKEKLTLKKLICVLFSIVGMVFISGVFENKAITKGEIKGIVLGLASAITYAVIIIANKRLKSISSFEQTFSQMFVCGVVMLIYSLLTRDIFNSQTSKIGLLTLVFVCVVHTGLAYLLYFGSFKKIDAQTIAILSYIDPTVAVIVSAIFDKPMTPLGIIGAVLIIGSSCLS